MQWHHPLTPLAKSPIPKHWGSRLFALGMKESTPVGSAATEEKKEPRTTAIKVFSVPCLSPK